LTISALRSHIADELKRKGIFSNVSLQVDVVLYASRSAIVLGGVVNPGLVFLDRTYRVSEILARAGGVKPGSSDYVVLHSPNGTERQISISDVATGDDAADPFVAPGDKIYIPMEVFYIKGQVKAPGAYPLALNMTLAMALARGGGLTDRGSDSHIRINRQGVEIKPDDLNFKVRPDDVVDVGESWF
jgi:polysaccharide biosynthesis/export protein